MHTDAEQLVELSIYLPRIGICTCGLPRYFRLVALESGFSIDLLLMEQIMRTSCLRTPHHNGSEKRYGPRSFQYYVQDSISRIMTIARKPLGFPVTSYYPSYATIPSSHARK